MMPEVGKSSDRSDRLILLAANHAKNEGCDNDESEIDEQFAMRFPDTEGNTSALGGRVDTLG
jgi:hypothetical protein